MRVRSSWVLVAVCAVGCAACASRVPWSGEDPSEQFRVEIAFEQPDGTRVVAPRITCRAGKEANVQAVRPYSYIQDYDVEVAQSTFIADPIVASVDEGVWVDFRVERGSEDQVELRYVVRRSTLKRPVATFTTSLGAFTAPVTIELPEVLVTRTDGTRILDAGVETRLARLSHEDGSGPLTVLVRALAVRVDELAPLDGESIGLEPE